jgi:hypothetical protein
MMEVIDIHAARWAVGLIKVDRKDGVSWHSVMLVAQILVVQAEAWAV